MQLHTRSARALTPFKLGTLAALCAWAAMSTQSALAQNTPTTSTADEQYRLGLYQRETGEPYSAIDTLESLLSGNPTLNRARLELAVAYYRTLNYQRAKEEAARVLADPKTPDAVRLSVSGFVKQIELEEAANFGTPHKFEPSVSAGLLYDSNVNAGPDNAVLGSSANGVLTLDAGSLAKADWGYQAQAGINHTWQRPGPVRIGQSTGKFSWNSSASAFRKGYFRYGDNNLDVLSLATGPALILGNNWRGNVNFELDDIYLGGDHLGLYTSMAPSSTWRIGSGGEFTLDGQWIKRDFDRNIDQGRDSVYRQVSVSYGQLVYKNKLSLQAGARYFDENAKAERFSNHGTEVFIGGRLRAWDGGDLFARAAWRQADYAGVEPVFGEARSEQEGRTEFGFSHLFAAGWLDKWQLAGTWTHVHNRANISLYGYDRDTVQFNLSRSF
jgi:hypothetical protein